MSLFSTLGGIGGAIGGFVLGGPAGAGVGYSLGSGIGRLADGTGSENADPALYDADPDRRALAEYRRLSDPTYGRQQFERMAASGATGAATFARGVAAQGGSVAQAREMAQASQAQASGQAFDAFQQFRAQTTAQAQNALGMEYQRAQNQISGVAGANERNADREASFTNNLFGVGLGLLGQQIGNGDGSLFGGGGGGGGANASPLDLVNTAMPAAAHRPRYSAPLHNPYGNR